MDQCLQQVTKYLRSAEDCRQHTLLAVVYLVFFILLSSSARAVVEGGPNDYYDSDPWTQQYLRAVEGHHLLPAEEQVVKGYTTSSTGAKFRNIWEEIDFTLRWFPNHPKGLQFMMRWLPKFPHPKDKGVEYYFEKAVEYRPSPKPRPVDANARLLYAIYLHKNKKYKKALKLYEEALSIAPNNSEIHYNLGLLYLAKKDYPSALKHAHIAYSLGYPLPGLRNKLMAIKQWKEMPVSQKTSKQKTSTKNTGPKDSEERLPSDKAKLNQ